MDIEKYKEIAKFLRYYSLKMSSDAASGHPTSSLSAADLMAVFIRDVFHFDFKVPDNPLNDRLIFSKGHASPLYYSLFAVAGALSTKDLENYRKFTSNLEGHPTFRFPYTEAATGSLGQGLSIGVGEAIALRLQIKNLKFKIKNFPKVYVLLGDGEMAEGSVWEALSLASHYKLSNLVGILDVNRLGQSDPTMLGHDMKTYQARIESFGWETAVIDGHDYEEINETMKQCSNVTMRGNEKPFMIIAKTYKGKGVSFLEDKAGWHGKPLPADLLDKAFRELGKVDLDLRVNVNKPSQRGISNFQFPISKKNKNPKNEEMKYKIGDSVATRKAYGEALASLGEKYPEIVALDAEVKNSTYSEIFKAKFPDRFFEMYIAEQNMVGAAVGMSRRGFIPFCSTFAAFLTRAFDQIRMSVLSGASIKFAGSHAGVSIGEDGPSQMGLEDLAMFRAIFGSTVIYPSDAVSTAKLVEEMVKTEGIVYMRTSRPTTTVIYDNNEKFPIGGSKVHRLKNETMKQFSNFTMKGKKIIIISAGVTLFEALKAQEELAGENIEAIVVDLYSVKPIDVVTLRKFVSESDVFVTVEDHWAEGGIGDAVLNVFAQDPGVKVYKLAVGKLPRSGKAAELMDYEGISASSIVRKIEVILQ